MCMSRKEKETGLFNKDEPSHKLWEGAFPDPRIMDEAFENGLEKVRELARQEND